METTKNNYSDKEKQELNKIKNKYLDENREKTNLEKMQELDRKATKTGKIVAWTLGIISSLVMGIGMSCVMVFDILIPGTLIGIIGLVGMIAVYPIYKHVVELDRQKVKDEILRLADEE